MKATELRIGNYVYYKCYGLEIDIPIYKIELGADIQVHQNHGYFKPIPLTEQWLKDFGGKKRKYTNDCNIWNISYGNYGLDSIKIWQYGAKFSFNLNYRSIKLPHVHKLQNLFFTLTNKELTKK